MSTTNYPRLASRARDTHPNHHLVNNNGTWWCQVTVHEGPISKRHRFSLKTRDLEKARERRDRIFAQLEAMNRSCRSLRQSVPAAARRSTPGPVVGSR